MAEIPHRWPPNCEYPNCHHDVVAFIRSRWLCTGHADEAIDLLISYPDPTEGGVMPEPRDTLLALTELPDIIEFIREHLDEDEVCRDLDEHVHEDKAHEAEVINNQGLEVQARYLARFSVTQFATLIADEHYPATEGAQ